MSRARKLGIALGYLVCFGGICWFLLPARYAALWVGSFLGISICLVGICLLFFYRRLVKKGGGRKVVARVCLACYVAGLLWCGYLTVLMQSVKYRIPPANTTVVVLGAEVRPNGNLSRTLHNRVSHAADYLQKNPKALCITTGGQGKTEPKTEALAEAEALKKMGVEEGRIYQEGRSHNTRQNMKNTHDLLERENLPMEIAVVTQEFHMFRALKLAEETGFTAYALPVKSDPFLYPGDYGRELLSLTKWHFERFFARFR